MRNQKMMILIMVWAISVILFGLGLTRPTYLVEKTMEVLDFEFSSKEAYGRTVEILRWMRWLYFGALTSLTFYLFQRQRSWQ